MSQASVAVKEIRQDLDKINQQILNHPYFQSLEQGKIQRERLRLFAGEQYAIIGSDLRSVAHLVSRFGESPRGDFFLGLLQGEKAAFDALLVFASALRMSEAELRSYEPLAGAHAYTAYMAWLALYGSAAQIAAAYLVNFPAWGQNCGRLSRIFKERFAMREEEVSFFNLFATVPPTFEPKCLEVIQSGLDCGEDAHLIKRVARLLQAYELMYWDTLYSASLGS